MYGFINKEELKSLQKVRENKEKDLGIWKYIMGREFVIMILSMFLALLSIKIFEIDESLEIKVIAIMCFIFAVICYIGFVKALRELTRENKKESKEQSDK